MSEIIMQEEANNPETPTAAGTWKLFFKSNGIFIIDDAGNETGPLGEAGAGAGDMLKATYDPDNNSIVDEAEATVVQCRKGSAGTINKGEACYISGYNVGGSYLEVELADANSAATMPAAGLAGEAITSAATGHLHLSGQLTGFDTSAFSVTDTLYVSGTAGGLTTTRPTGATDIVQHIAIVLRSHATLGAVQIIGSAHPHDVPNLTSGKLWIGNGSNLPAETSASATPGASTVPIADGGGKLDGWISSSSTTTPGLSEAAIASEVNTGTDAARAVTPDALAGSNFGIRYVSIQLNTSTALTTGDNKARVRIPAGLNGMNLVSVAATRQSGTGTPSIQVRNVTQTADMLTTPITIDTNETDSSTAATPAAIDAANDDVATGDQIAIDVDDAGTDSLSVTVELGFQLP